MRCKDVQAVTQAYISYVSSYSVIDTTYVLQVEDDTSSANNGFPGLGAPLAMHMDSHAEMPQVGAGAPGMSGLMTQVSIPESEAYGEEEANKKDTAAADDLRELAAKGVCAPLWRTNQPVQPVKPSSLLYSAPWP